MSIYGTQLAPATPAGAALDSEGRLATQLAGTQVLFNGIPASSPGQLNALVPYRIGGPATVTVQVNTATDAAPPATLHIAPAQPAAPGSAVTIFASGAGLLPPNPPDGSIPPSTLVPFSQLMIDSESSAQFSLYF